MRPKHILIICFIILFIVNNARSIPPIGSIEELRPKGSERTYLINYKEEQAGALVSKFDGKTKFEDVSCYRFSENYTLNLNPYDVEYNITTINNHYVNDKGRYVGDDMTITVNEQIQKLYLINKDNKLTGYFRRGETKEDINLPAFEEIMAVDNNMVDQIEIFLAFHNVYPGDTIYDSIFVPQSRVKTPVRVAVEDFKWVRYGKLYDSAYVCHFLEPSEQYVYYTKSRKVIRIDQKTQDLQIILYESPLDKMAPEVRAFSIFDFIQRVPIYLVYLIFGIIFVSPFLRNFYKKFEIYLIFILGAVMFLLLKETLFPLQKWYGEQYLIPGVEAGNSLYLYAIFTALFSGLFQEAAKMIPLLLVYFWKKPRQQLSIALGVFCGVGLGVAMAGSLSGQAYQSGGLKIISAGVFGQIITILFYGIAGAAFGYGLNRGIKYLSIIWPATVLVHAFSDYLLVFQQRAIFNMSILEFIRTLICLIYFLAVYVLIKKARRQN